MSSVETNGCGYDYSYWFKRVSQIISKETLNELESYVGEEHIGILTLQIENFYSLVGSYGEDTGFQLLETMKEEAVRLFPVFFSHCRLIAIEDAKVNEILILLLLPERCVNSFSSEALSFRINFRNALNERILEIAGQQLDVLVGHAWIGKDERQGFHKILFRSFCDAQRIASNGPDPTRLAYHKDFIEILRCSLLRCIYQPVVDLATGGIFGWEAFIRGPEGSRFEDSAMLFGYAEEIGKIFTLERKCREQAVMNLGGAAHDQILFLNIHMQSLNDPAFTPGATTKLLREFGLRPENIVIEFSEKQGIQDYNLLLECLEHYRNRNFRVALDDVGAGHASIQAISQVRPDFIKTDVSLTRGIDFNPIKRIMVETFITLAEKIGSKVIVEGIETETEFSSLVSMGVHYGQGHFIARPAHPKPYPAVSIPVKASFSEGAKIELKCSTPVHALVQPALQVSPRTTVQEVKTMLIDRPPISSVAIVDGFTPVGLLMNYNLDRQLGTTYGVSLYYHREVSRIMDRVPLVVEADEAVEKVAKAAMNRDNQKVYDDIIVTEKGVFIGTISVQKMLDTLARVQVEMAKGANPLTGLPGNVAIEQEINRRAASFTPSSLIYIDIDNFKVYNDAYGFDRGDKVILFTSAVLEDALKKAGGGGEFLGHVGGDDFVIIAGLERAEDISLTIIELFEKDVPSLYSETDRKRGYIRGKGRDGTEREYPFISLSIGIVDCEFRCSFNMDELSLRVADVKKCAKAIRGNAYFRDRRAPIGSTVQSQPEDDAPPYRIH